MDREAGILPWGAPPEVPRISPVEAAAEYLRHIRDAWNFRFASKDASARLEEQEVVLTVPASFDEAARELTLESAKAVGLNRFVLLEEPQAAFYCWIVSHQDGWQNQVRAGEMILVCDIGGGTTDFSLITVVETPTGPGFRRVAVGDHLMLGGDNIDLALAHRIEANLGPSQLDTEQWSSLRLACRTAKEKILSVDDLARWPVTIPGRGSKLIGGSIQTELTREVVHETVLDGFFPLTKLEEEPTRGPRLGLQEFGLPFVADPAMTRHLASFLRRHRTEAIGEGGHSRATRPDAVLFNGGALTPRILRHRIVEALQGWFRDESNESYAPRVLSNESLDLAVAIGAAYYGVVRRGGGIRIGGGTARSLYVGFESSGPSRRPWLCVVSRDAQEGDEVTITDHDFDLLMGQPTAFPLASSSVRANDRPGDLVEEDLDSILVLPPLIGQMRVGRKAKAQRVPVALSARVTEVGTVELWCHSRTDERRWRLQIQLRGATEPPTDREANPTDENDHVVLEQSEIDSASTAIQAAFAITNPNDPAGVARLVKRLEEVLDLPRDRWPSSALRALWEPLRESTEARLRSPRHESRWLNLAGFFLRPGVGVPLDESRVKSLWPVFHVGLKHIKDAQCWSEWWIVWRRVAAGLNRTHQEEILRRLSPYLDPPRAGAGTKKPSRPRPEAHELAEMWRFAAAMERLPAATKTSLGALLIGELDRPTLPGHVLWCLGRLGSRTPMFGPANTVVDPRVATSWSQAIMARDHYTARQRVDAISALVQIGRVSGDRSRDLEPSIRERIVARLTELDADESSLRPIREYHALGAAEQDRILGDAVPIGLRLRDGEAMNEP